MSVGESTLLDELCLENERLKEELLMLKGERQEIKFDLEERLKELGCLYELDLMEQNDTWPASVLLKEIARVLPNAWKNPSETKVTILFDGACYGDEQILQSSWKMTYHIAPAGIVRGEIIVVYTGDTVGSPFIPEEYNLLRIIAHRIETVIEFREKQNSLSNSETRAEVYFNSKLVGMAETSLDKGWIKVNDRLCEILGYSREELMKMTWEELTYPDDIEPDVAQFNRVLSGDIDRYTMEKRFIHKSGEIIYAFIAAEAVRFPFGDIDYFVALVQDITPRKKMEVALQEKEMFLGAVVNATPDLIYVYDLHEKKNLYSNERLDSVLGYTPAEIQGMGANLLGKLLHPNDLDSYIENVYPLYYELADGEILEHSYRMKKANDEYIRLLSREVIFHHNEKGIADQILGVAHDITHRYEMEMQLKESQEMYQNLAELSRDMISLHNENGVYLYVSPVVTEILGYSQEEVLGTCAYDYFHPEDTTIIENHHRVSLQDLRHELFSYRIRKKDGTWLWVETVNRLIENNGEKQLLCTTRDISERKRLEGDLRRSNRDLEQFAFLASHDLQEPLRMVSGYTSLLQRRFSDQLNDEGREFIQFASDGAQRMQSMISDLLQFSRVSSSRFGNPELVDMGNILEKVKGNLALSIEESGAIIETGELVPIEGHPSLILLLFKNLVSNSIKYCERMPEIHIDSSYRSDGMIVYQFRDNGIGIEEKYFSRIFQIFQRLHTKEKYTGNGVGLSLCQRIVERYNGHINLISTPGEGTTFVLTFPNNNKENV